MTVLGGVCRTGGIAKTLGFVLFWTKPFFRKPYSYRRNDMYEKVSTDLNFVEREKKIQQFWKDNDIFEKSIDSRKEV